MEENIGLRPKDRTFLVKWSRIRENGKTQYILTRGVLWGLLLFAVWLVVTVIEISLSEFKTALYRQDSVAFMRRCIIMFACEMLIGGVIARSRWNGNEERYRYLEG